MEIFLWNLVALVLHFVQMVDASGKLEIKFVEFAITKYVKCDCVFLCEKEGGCDPYFTVCAKPDIHASSSAGPCLGGNAIVTSTLDNTNRKVFTGTIGSTPNPIVIPFQNWQGSGIKFSFDIKDDDGDNPPYAIEKLASEVVTLGSNHTSKLNLRGRKTSLNVNIKYYCDEGWYGDNCSLTSPPPTKAPAQKTITTEEPAETPVTTENPAKPPVGTKATTEVPVTKQAPAEAPAPTTASDKCSSSPCIHGNCSEDAGGYLCSCDTGYTGLKCETQINECASDPCGPNGECQDMLNGYKCVCNEGFSGDSCEVNIDDCLSSPCVHGTCIDGTASFQCQCLLGFTGQTCEVNVDDCLLNPCKNNGTCQDGINSYMCQCGPGFTGQNCQTKLDFCKSQPCGENGKCTSKQKGYFCDCDEGFSGMNCETNIDECLANSCGEHGKCVDGIASFSCDCEPGYTGKLCNVKTDYCLDNECGNGSTCVNLVLGYKCVCPPEKVGMHCELENPCLRRPCLNEGICKASNKAIYNCTCTKGYQGDICQHKMIFPSISKRASSKFVLKDKPTAYQTKALLDVVQEATAWKLNVSKLLITVKYGKELKLCTSTSNGELYYRLDFTVWLGVDQIPAELVQESLQNAEAQIMLPRLSYTDTPCMPSSAQVSSHNKGNNMMNVYIISSIAVACFGLGTLAILIVRRFKNRRRKQDIEQRQLDSYSESISYPEKYTNTSP